MDTRSSNTNSINSKFPPIKTVVSCTQILAAIIVLSVSLYNLTQDSDSKLWNSLLYLSFGILIPSHYIVKKNDK